MEKQLNPEDFRMPAEWEPHEGTWLQWPHDDQWPGYQLKLEKTWLEMAAALHEHENVYIIAQDERHQEHLEQQFHFFGIGLRGIDFYIIPTNDIWARDDGPIFVTNKEGNLAITNWKFNGWGGRYEHQIDDQVVAISISPSKQKERSEVMKFVGVAKDTDPNASQQHRAYFTEG